MNAANFRPPTMKQKENSSKPMKLLVVDDDPASLELLSNSLVHDEFEVLTTQDPHQALEMCAREHPRIVMTELHLPAMNGMELMERILESDGSTEVILLTGEYSLDAAVKAIHSGACDYLTKPVDLPKLRARIAKVVESVRLRERTLQLDQELIRAFMFEGIVGRSPAILDVFATVRRVAPHFRTALVTGPTGTGKELVARALHRLSPSANKTFAVCNCSALVETLLESELFGYVRGAFTGATQDSVGLFEYANGGTVFLDEIGDMPMGGQAKLLRVLQNQEVMRVGSPVARKIDVHVIAATNRDLRTLVAQKKFREDLYYRLSMVEIQIPPLAARKEDLPLLQRHFLEKFSRQYNKSVKGISRPAASLLSQYNWPGNVRELENILGNACMMADGPAIDIGDLPAAVKQPQAVMDDSDTELLSFEEVERRHLTRVLAAVEGDKSRAAQILGVSRSTLYALLAKNKSAGAGRP
jgi:DNA-binding NtrC family response regulator